MSDDNTTISVSAEGQAVLDQLTKDHKYFGTELSAFLACAALAVALGLAVEEDFGASGQTKWNKGSGAIGEWSQLVEWYLPTAEPVRALKQYGETGLRHVRSQLALGRSLGDIFVVIPSGAAAI